MLNVCSNNEIRKTRFYNNIVYQNKNNCFRYELLCCILDDDIILQTILGAFCELQRDLSKREVQESRIFYNTQPDVKHGTSRISDRSRHQQLEER